MLPPVSLYKSKIYLGLLKKHSNTLDSTLSKPTIQTFKYKLELKQFNKIYVSALNIVYIYEYLSKLTQFPYNQAIFTKKIFYFYAKLSQINRRLDHIHILPKVFQSYQSNNFICFSKPTSQIFLLIFKNKPVFIFTGGLMRIVMNEKRKSSKKNFKVALSLIKLTSILLIKKQYFDSCYIKLNNVGSLRHKILNIFNKTNTHNYINYIIFKLHFNFTAQKMPTRRSIKKYVKKRFKLNT